MIIFACDYCGGEGRSFPSDYKRKKKHFCKRECYGRYISEVKKPEEQNAWKGGVSPADASRRWRRNNIEKARASDRARRLRELNAPGRHTKEEWEEIKRRHNYTCAMKDDTCKGRLTKDHKIPLELDGTNWPDNLQPLCHSHNSRKRHKLYVGNFEEE